MRYLTYQSSLTDQLRERPSSSPTHSSFCSSSSSSSAVPAASLRWEERSYQRGVNDRVCVTGVTLENLAAYCLFKMQPDEQFVAGRSWAQSGSERAVSSRILNLKI